MSPDALAQLRAELNIKKPRAARTSWSESKHQIALFHWAKLATSTRPELAWLHSTLNGAPLPQATANRLKAEGMTAGVPDIFLDVKRGVYSGLRIELKTPRIEGIKGVTKTVQAGKATDAQTSWLAHYRAQGFVAEIAYGWLDAKTLIEEYLNGVA